MKPDGVDTATMEPMEALNADPVIEVEPVGEVQDQVLPAVQTQEIGQGELLPVEALSAANKTEGKEKPVDPKAKTKAPTKTKTPAAGTKASTTSSRPTTGQSRITNGSQKPQTNGATKKPTAGGLEKKNSTTTASKRTTGPTAAPTTKTPTKVAEKKPVGMAKPASAPANGVKTTGTVQPTKKAPTAPANGIKAKPKTAAPAPRPASTSKPSTTGSPKPDKPPVSKTTRPVGSATVARSSPAAPKPATPTTATKTSTSASRPTSATPKTPSSTAKPSPVKTTAPSAGRTPTQPPKATTPIKKDVSKQPSTPAAKKASATPPARAVPAKTTKPSTPKSAPSAKPESASKKPTTSKAPDAKPSKPKESKATPSKEVNASPKPTGSKPKTSSPKKTVGSSTPMPVKRGPKAAEPVDTAATEGKREDVVPTVAAVGATVAAAAAVSIAASVEASEHSAMEVVPAASEEAPEELFTPGVPEASEVKSEDTVTPAIPASTEETSNETVTPVSPPVIEETPEDRVTPVSPPVTEETSKETVTPVSPPATEETSKETVTPVSPPATEETPEDLFTPTIPVSSEVKFDETEIPESEETPVIPPTTEEAPEDTVTPAIPFPTKETPKDTIQPVSPFDTEEDHEDIVQPASPFDTEEDHEDIVQPVSAFDNEEGCEDTVQSVSAFNNEEDHEDTVQPVSAFKNEEAPKDTFEFVSAFAIKEETVTGHISPVSKETHVDTVKPGSAFDTEEDHEDTFEPVSVFANREELEDTVTPVSAPASEAVQLDYDQDIPQSVDNMKEDTAATQLTAEIEAVSLEESMPAVSPLGTTVLSPPSSPTGPVSTQCSAEPWAESVSLHPSTATVEILEQDEERIQDDTWVPSTAPENLVEDFDLLNPTGGDHFSGAVPVSPCQEREEAVEKAEEEINEDNDEEEEEEEEEEREVAVEETVPQTEIEDEFKKTMADVGSSGWGMMQSDDINSSKQYDVEVTSPFNAENSAKEMGDLLMNEPDIKQPLTDRPNVPSFCDEEEDEEEAEEEEHNKEDHADYEHYKEQKEPQEEEEDVEMVSGDRRAEYRLGVRGNNSDDDDNDYKEESYQGLKNMSYTAPAPSVPMTAAWSDSNPFSDPWAQTASFLTEPSLLDTSLTDPDTTTKFQVDPDTPPRSPAEAFMDTSAPLIQASEPHTDIKEETDSLIPTESAILVAPAIGMSQSSTLSGTALAAHSSSETSTPEELRDYDSSSGVESRSDKQQTPVPVMQMDTEQDLGIHLERGDGEEEEAETLPADEVLGDAATAPASVPSSPSSSGDEASDTEGEMQINDPDVTVDDGTTAAHNLTALEEDEEAPEQLGEEDGGTPQSANSVASYGFDCSVSNSNAQSMAESCGKSPGIFSLENEEQLPEEAKDPSFIKELTLPAAAAYSDDLLGCPVDLLPISEPTERDTYLDEHYIPGRKTEPGAMEEVDPESPMHVSPQHGDESDDQPPYYSAICDKTDNFLAGKPRSSVQKSEHQLSVSQQENGNDPLTQEMNDNNYLTPLQIPQAQPRNNALSAEPHRCPAITLRVPQTALMCDGQLRRVDRQQLQLQHMRQRQEQERLQRLCVEEELQRQEQQRALERQRRELLQLQLQQQQQEQKLRMQLLQRQLEMEQQQRHKQQQLKGQPAPLLLSPSSGLCTIYEAMETSEEEEEEEAESRSTGKKEYQTGRSVPTDLPLRVANGNLRRPPPQELDWNTKLDMVQELINQTLLLAGEDGCPPLLYLPGQGGGILSPLESSLWPHIMSHFDSSTATVASVSSYSPSSRGSSPQGDWTVVELETHH